MVILEVEATFRAPVVNPDTGHVSRTYELGGRVDAIVALESGRVAIFEHKTTSEDLATGSAYWRRVSALDSQASTYYVGAKALGYDVDCVIYDVLRKPALRPLKATANPRMRKDGLPAAGQRLTDETPGEYHDRIVAALSADPEKYFARGEVVRLEEDERSAAQDLWAQARLIREAELEQRWPRNPDACHRYGRFCSYLPVCAGETGIDNDALYRTADEAHEELVVEEVSGA
jgi:hypothetical protein